MPAFMQDIAYSFTAMYLCGTHQEVGNSTGFSIRKEAATGGMVLEILTVKGSGVF